MTHFPLSPAAALLGATLLAGDAGAKTAEPSTTDGPERRIEQAFSAFTDAMLAGDTGALRALTGERFTLMHMTGLVQPGDEWLAGMRCGEFVYHRIDVRDVRVTVSGTMARLVARTLTDASVYGGRNEWRLQLDLDYAWRGDRWIAERAAASIWN